ncbi:hypothetical protein G9A89_008079 [Geosiphon pyriformis]|nr:hypothetical protein G9A89_008079 [Geosiphon pyriformis]
MATKKYVSSNSKTLFVTITICFTVILFSFVEFDNKSFHTNFEISRDQKSNGSKNLSGLRNAYDTYLAQKKIASKDNDTYKNGSNRNLQFARSIAKTERRDESNKTLSVPKILVVDTKLLDKFYHYAFYANKAYCATSGNARIFNGLFGHVELLENEIIVYMRGDEYNHGQKVEINLEVTEYPNAGTGAMVVSSFLTDYEEAKLQIFKEIEVLIVEKKRIKLRLVGHGLGGVYAIFLALDLKKVHFHIYIEIYTYGQPRMGNAIFARYVNKMFSRKLFRITHTDDRVSQFPMSETRGAFRHFDTEYWINYAEDCGCVDPYRTVELDVYRCASTQVVDPEGSYDFIENQNCNVGVKHEIIIPGITSHWGPYFNQRMGDCLRAPQYHEEN